MTGSRHGFSMNTRPRLVIAADDLFCRQGKAATRFAKMEAAGGISRGNLKI